MDDLAGDLVTRGNFHLFARPHPRTTFAAAWYHLSTCQRREFRGRCVAFLGSPGAGKSTTAAAFARDGHAVLSDDIVALVDQEGTFEVLPAYPHLCLWPDSVTMLYGSPDALPRFSTNWEKRRLALGKEERALRAVLSSVRDLSVRRTPLGLCALR